MQCGKTPVIFRDFFYFESYWTKVNFRPIRMVTQCSTVKPVKTLGPGKFQRKVFFSCTVIVSCPFMKTSPNK